MDELPVNFHSLANPDGFEGGHPDYDFLAKGSVLLVGSRRE